MKLEKTTIAILKNYAGINQSIVFPEDNNTLRTCSVQKTIVAASEVDNVFPKKVGIYDLNQFLATLSLFEDPDLEFEDSHVVIKSGRKRSRYYYTDPKMIMSPPDKDLAFPDPVTKFSLPSAIRTAAMKAANVLQVENLVIEASEDSVNIVVKDKKNQTSNTFEEGIEEFEHSGEPKNYVFRVDNLKLLDLNYEVELTDKGISQFVGGDGKVKYWVATEKE